MVVETDGYSLHQRSRGGLIGSLLFGVSFSIFGDLAIFDPG